MRREKTALSYWFPKIDAAGIPAPKTTIINHAEGSARGDLGCVRRQGCRRSQAVLCATDGRRERDRIPGVPADGPPKSASTSGRPVQ